MLVGSGGMGHSSCFDVMSSTWEHHFDWPGVQDSLLRWRKNNQRFFFLFVCFLKVLKSADFDRSVEAPQEHEVDIVRHWQAGRADSDG